MAFFQDVQGILLFLFVRPAHPQLPDPLAIRCSLSENSPGSLRAYLPLCVRPRVHEVLRLITYI